MLSEFWTKSSRLQNAQHFLKGGGGSQRVGHEMPVFSRNEAENGEREREREKCNRRLGGHGNPCRGRDGAVVSSEGFQRDEDRVRTPDDVRAGKSRG